LFYIASPRGKSEPGLLQIVGGLEEGEEEVNIQGGKIIICEWKTPGFTLRKGG